jgi:hypothetical protein
MKAGSKKELILMQLNIWQSKQKYSKRSKCQQALITRDAILAPAAAETGFPKYHALATSVDIIGTK